MAKAIRALYRCITCRHEVLRRPGGHVMCPYCEKPMTLIGFRPVDEA